MLRVAWNTRANFRIHVLRPFPLYDKVAEQPVSQVNASEKTMQEVARKLRQASTSSPDFWPTVAAIINYQSRINQMTGRAPDPAKVSTPCMGVTGGVRNTFDHFGLAGCVVDLDTQTFLNGIFKDSVIRYHGGQTTLRNVTFINCTFLLDLSSPKTSPEKSSLLFALLGSLDQKTVKIE